MTTKERFELHSSVEPCTSCHRLIDPIGFGFEHFDHLGRWRIEDAGQPIDASGSLDGVEFDGVQDLAIALMDDARFRACYVQTWRRWKGGADSCADDPGAAGQVPRCLGTRKQVARGRRLIPDLTVTVQRILRPLFRD